MVSKCILILLIFTNTYVAQELVTDRPDQTESAVTVPKHSLQIETGIAYERLKENNISVGNYSIAGTLVRYSFINNFEVRIGGGYFISNGEETKDNFNDLLIGFKINFLQEDYAPIELGLLVHAIVPVFPLVSFQSIEPELIFAISRSLSNQFSISANFGGSYSRQWSENIYIYTGSLGMSINEELNAFVEIYGNFSTPFSAIHNFDGGITYLLNNEFQFDMSAGRSINGIDFAWFVSSGISIRFSNI